MLLLRDMSSESERLSKDELQEYSQYGEAYHQLLKVFTDTSISEDVREKYLTEIEQLFPESTHTIARKISDAVQASAIRTQGINEQVLYYSNAPEGTADADILKRFYLGILKNHLQSLSSGRVIDERHWKFVTDSAEFKVSPLGYPEVSLSKKAVQILERLAGVEIEASGIHLELNANGVQLQMIVMYEHSKSIQRHELHHAIYSSQSDLLHTADISEEHIDAAIFDRIRNELMAYLISHAEGMNVTFDLEQLIWGVVVTDSEKRWLTTQWPQVQQELLKCIERLKAEQLSPLTLLLPIGEASSISELQSIFENILPGKKAKRKWWFNK